MLEIVQIPPRMRNPVKSRTIILFLTQASISLAITALYLLP